LLTANKNLLFLKKTNLKKIKCYPGRTHYLEHMHSAEGFSGGVVKLSYYHHYFEKNSIQVDDFNSDSIYYVSLNKKRNHYHISIIKNNLLHGYISLGTILQFFNFEKKYLRRSKKGFNIFISAFKRFFKQIDYENVNLSVNFLDFNFLSVRKNLFKGVLLNNFFLFKLNLNHGRLLCKKYKNIKRRMKKKFLKRYVL
jgi:hypothetical protein